jgi:V/A-type H+-transporting ATPase subunit E
MADIKLQQLIETLKQQGVESGEETSRGIIEGANSKADEILLKAKAEASAIVSSAREEADKNRRQLQSSMEIAASQLMTDLKRTIEEQLLALPLKRKITETLDDTNFLKELMTTCVREYVKNPEHNDLSVLVSKEQQEKITDFTLELIKALPGERKGDRVTLNLKSDGVAFGFIIGTGDGVVRLDFTDEAFLELFLKYLTPRFRSYFKAIDVKGLSSK